MAGKHEAQTEQVGTQDATGNFIFSQEQLLQLLQSVATQKSGDSEAAAITAQVIGDKIASALLESRKPWVDPRVEQNEETFRASLRMIEKNKRENIATHQKQCPHIQGCNALSEMQHPSGLTCIAWHVTDLGEFLGLCLNCGREFWPGQKDYAKWRGQKSGCRLSRSGARELPNPTQSRIIARQTARDITKTPEAELEYAGV